MSGPPWANTKASDPLSRRSDLLFKGNQNYLHPGPPEQGPRAQAWAQGSLEVGSAPKIKQNFLPEKGEVCGRGGWDKDTLSKKAEAFGGEAGGAQRGARDTGRRHRHS